MSHATLPRAHSIAQSTEKGKCISQRHNLTCRHDAVALKVFAMTSAKRGATFNADIVDAASSPRVTSDITQSPSNTNIGLDITLNLPNTPLSS